ncbi:hypothetical protein FBZ96_105686 [Bradyrhizobium stylosanthis]|uniref:Uncharacterized protein n=1 Tax=Bradyrhizobium stylosanthis TaxID=1803665 RepID=A0A560DPG0_9BRAD|nr:hypothetical protein FBZ96_105686 [Bradyrhizobium stylosanthis]
MNQNSSLAESFNLSHWVTRVGAFELRILQRKQLLQESWSRAG